MQFLSGYKTYIVAAVTVLYALVELWTGAMDVQHAIPFILAAFGAVGLRSGLTASVLKVLAALGIDVSGGVPNVENIKTQLATGRAAAASAARNAARNGTAALILGLILLGGVGGLYGCASTGSGGGSAAQAIGDGLAVGSGFQGAYITTCLGLAPPSYCVGTLPNAKKASHAFAVTAADLVHTYEAGGDTTLLLAQLVADAADLQGLITQMQNAVHANARGRSTAIDPITVITLLNTGLQVLPQVVALVQELKNGVSNTQLDTLVQTIQNQDAQIQAAS